MEGTLDLHIIVMIQPVNLDDNSRLVLVGIIRRIDIIAHGPVLLHVDGVHNESE
jgi:hypothetical protein